MSSLSPEVAQRIVDRTMAVIGRNVNVMDDRGLILATGHPDRLRRSHEGALVAAQRDRVVTVDDDQARLLQGTRPGVNVPLHHFGRVVGVVGISGDPDEVQVYAELIRVAAELIVEQAGLLESGQRLRQERDDLLVAVVAERVDDETAQRRALALGIAPRAGRTCTLVEAVGADSGELVRALQRRLDGTREVLVARTGPDELAVWWPSGDHAARDEVARAVADLDDPPGSLLSADGESFDGIDGLRRARRTAGDALAVADLPGDLYERGDLPLVALLGRLRDDERAAAVAAPWRALVAADPHGELRATLRAWFEHGLHPGRCAAELHVHRNTLRGRIERIERITGLDLRRVPSLLRLYVGPLLDRPVERPRHRRAEGGLDSTRYRDRP